MATVLGYARCGLAGLNRSALRLELLGFDSKAVNPI